MDKPLFSENWYRVRALKPALRSHVKLHRQAQSNEVWYILEDTASGRYHRFNTAAYHIIAQMDGQRTVEAIWEAANTLLGDDAPVQDDIIQVLGKLHHIDVLRTDIPPDLEELLQREQEQRRAQVLSRIKNPLSLKLRLVDPDRFLDKTLPAVAWIFSRPALALWAVLVGLAWLLAASHWQSLVETTRYQALTPYNLMLLYLIFPGVKLLHELGHAYAAKLEGGEVHEMGIIFMVFVPVPYVDASAANTFTARSKRVLVGAAGMMTELYLAAFALFLWLNVSPGLVSSICLNVMLIGGISTLFFNGNPLLRFDGYYILGDLLGIQNLAQRANAFYGYLVQRFAFGMESAASPAHSRYEAGWFLLYAPLSLAYRLGILLAIALFLMEELFMVGVILAIWAVFSQLLLPLLKQLDFLLLSPRLRSRRPRALLASTLAATVVGAAIGWVPATSLSTVEGVVYPPENSHLVAQTDGFVAEVLARDGTEVSEGQALIRLYNEKHRAELAVAEARIRELQARYVSVRSRDLVQAKLAREEMETVRADIERIRSRIDALTIASPVTGIFYQLPGDDLIGRYITRGERLGYVVSRGDSMARVVVVQDDLDRILQGVEKVEVRLASRLDTVVPGELKRAVPQGSFSLPSPVLSTEGGGPFVTDADGEQPLATRERVFEFEVELPQTVDARVGTRVFVRFDHGSETLFDQWHRSVRQLFLRRLGT